MKPQEQQVIRAEYDAWAANNGRMGWSDIVANTTGITAYEMYAADAVNCVKSPDFVTCAFAVVGFIPGIGKAGKLGKLGKASDDVGQAAGSSASRATKSADDSLSLSTGESWGNPATLEDRFTRHGSDFAATSADDYAAQASQFFQRSQVERLPTRIDSDGTIRVYEPSTNTFGSFNPNGTPRTFFKPSSPTYWSGQPGQPPVS